MHVFIHICCMYVCMCYENIALTISSNPWRINISSKIMWSQKTSGENNVCPCPPSVSYTHGSPYSHTCMHTHTYTHMHAYTGTYTPSVSAEMLLHSPSASFLLVGWPQGFLPAPDPTGWWQLSAAGALHLLPRVRPPTPCIPRCSGLNVVPTQGPMGMLWQPGGKHSHLLSPSVWTAGHRCSDSRHTACLKRGQPPQWPGTTSLTSHSLLEMLDGAESCPWIERRPGFSALGPRVCSWPPSKRSITQSFLPTPLSPSVCSLMLLNMRVLGDNDMQPTSRPWSLPQPRLTPWKKLPGGHRDQPLWVFFQICHLFTYPHCWHSFPLQLTFFIRWCVLRFQ